MRKVDNLKPGFTLISNKNPGVHFKMVVQKGILSLIIMMIFISPDLFAQPGFLKTKSDTVQQSIFGAGMFAGNDAIYYSFSEAKSKINLKFFSHAQVTFRYKRMYANATFSYSSGAIKETLEYSGEWKAGKAIGSEMYGLSLGYEILDWKILKVIPNVFLGSQYFQLVDEEEAFYPVLDKTPSHFIWSVGSMLHLRVCSIRGDLHKRPGYVLLSFILGSTISYYPKYYATPFDIHGGVLSVVIGPAMHASW